ncbi:MAG: SEC-C domain-containing protein [Actinomycetota bacterium]|nr:SEC-C domain-containing protein [Actinomycetota bacterium]
MPNKTSQRPPSAKKGKPAARAEGGGLNPRRPCECGSGRRWKSCHGAADAADMIVSRPFAGMKGEVELIAMREFVPSATVPLTLVKPGKDAPSVTLATVLPGAAAALTRSDGSILIGLQTQVHSGDLSRDLGGSLRWALDAQPSSMLQVAPRDAENPTLAELIVDELLAVTVHHDFGWWLENEAEAGSEVALSLEQANSAIMPTARIGELPGAYWVDAGDKAHLRWVRPEDEAQVMAALARLAAAGELDLGEGTRYVGSFRAHGRLVPVWDLDREAHSSEWERPASDFAERYATAVADPAPLTSTERRARDGILGRQFTLR